MTSILGFNCVDGVLMLADTEETTSAGTKSDCDKLTSLSLPCGRLLLGGAGSSHFIEYATAVLEREFLQQSRTWPEIISDINRLAKRIGRDTLGGFKGFASELVPSSIAMLLAVNMADKTLLFRWEHDVVVLVKPYEHTSVGSGTIQSHPMLRDIRFSIAAESMLFYGVRVMQQTKRIVTGVGGKTEAVVLHNDGTSGYFSTGITANIEEIVTDFEDLNHQVLMFLIADMFSTDQDFESALLKLLDRIRMLRERRRKRFS